MPIDKGTSKPITQLSGLQINYKDKYSCFNPPIVTIAERNALVNTDDPKNPIKDGTTVFNSDSGYEEYYSSKADKWIQIKEGGGGTGDVTGPENAVDGNLVAFDGTSGKVIKDSGVSTNLVVSASSASVKKGQIPVWYNTTAGKISIANSGVTVDQIKPKNTRKNVNEPELYQLSNLGALQFGSNDNVADTGVILVDGLTPVTFQTQGTGADSRVCTVINGELGEGSSSPSALLEINSTEGGFLNARLTTAQRDSLLDPKDGLVIYNTDTKNLNIRQNGAWVEIKSGGSSGGISGPTVSTENSLTFWNSNNGSSVDSSDITVSDYVLDSQQNTIKSTLNNVGDILFHSSGSNRRIYIDPSASGGGYNPNQIFIDGDLEIKCLYSGMNMTGASNDAKFSVYLPGGIGGVSCLTLSDMNGTLQISKPYTSASGTKLNWTFPSTNGTKGQILTNTGNGNTGWSDIGAILPKLLSTSDPSINISGLDNISYIIANTVNNDIAINIPAPSTSPYYDGNVGKVYTIKAYISGSRTVSIKWGIVENPQIVISSATSTLTIISTGTVWEVLSKTTTY